MVQALQGTQRWIEADLQAAADTGDVFQAFQRLQIGAHNEQRAGDVEKAIFPLGQFLQALAGVDGKVALEHGRFGRRNGSVVAATEAYNKDHQNWQEPDSVHHFPAWFLTPIGQIIRLTWWGIWSSAGQPFPRVCIALIMDNLTILLICEKRGRSQTCSLLN